MPQPRFVRDVLQAGLRIGCKPGEALEPELEDDQHTARTPAP